MAIRTIQIVREIGDETMYDNFLDMSDKNLWGSHINKLKIKWTINQLQTDTQLAKSGTILIKSILLTIKPPLRIELRTPCLQGKCSTTEL